MIGAYRASSILRGVSGGLFERVAMAFEDPLTRRALTFAFTDIEGSTARWERDRTAMEEAVRRHDALVRRSIEQHGGRVFKTMGDAFFAVFTTGADAVAAMLAAQRSLMDEDFSAVDGLRVRAAIHAGTADERDGDYFGPTLNKVARLLAIGHGGQVLLTAEAATLTTTNLPAEASLRELGTYHLKDFVEPQRVFQLAAPRMQAEFPPLRSLGTLPSDLSIIDAVEFHPVPTFTGRDAELAAVRAALRNESAIVVLHGLGGVGKSSIAREYGWRNRDEYSVLWWLNAQTEGGIVDGLLRLGAMFERGLEKLADRRAAAQRVINSMLGGFDKPALLVFDNLEDEALMRSWLPRTGTRAVATSRDAAFGGDIVAVPLQFWPLETAVDYLERASGRKDLTEKDARAIAVALGALPLALVHAAASLRTLRMVSPQRYLDRLTEHLKTAPRGADYPRSVFATFRTAIAQAELQAPGAAAVLCFAALFAPDAIPDELFRQPTDRCPRGLLPPRLEVEALDLHTALSGDIRLDEALGALDRLSLLTFVHDQRTYNMHRLVQLAGKDLIGAEPGWNDFAVGAADAAFPEVEFATWPRCERVLSHAHAALDALGTETVSPTAASLASRCAAYLRDRGDYVAAESLAKRALAIVEMTSGKDHPEVAQRLNDVATAYWYQGRYAEAEQLYSRALAILESELGPEHPSVARSLNHIAVICQERGRYAEAESLHARALSIRENAFGPEHPNIAYSLNNLANVYAAQGRLADAERLHSRALTIREKAFPPDHPEIAFSVNNLANVYDDQGRYAEAEPLHIRALAIWEKAMGPEHPDAAYSLNNLGNAYRNLGRLAESEASHVRALTTWEKALGPDHPYVADALVGLALTYDQLGRVGEAETLLLRALAIRTAALGSDHPMTKDAIETLDSHRSRK